MTPLAILLIWVGVAFVAVAMFGIGALVGYHRGEREADERWEAYLRRNEPAVVFDFPKRESVNEPDGDPLRRAESGEW